MCFNHLYYIIRRKTYAMFYPFLVNLEYARHCRTRNSYNASNASKSYCIHRTAWYWRQIKARNCKLSSTRCLQPSDSVTYVTTNNTWSNRGRHWNIFLAKMFDSLKIRCATSAIYTPFWQLFTERNDSMTPHKLSPLPSAFLHKSIIRVQFLTSPKLLDQVTLSVIRTR